MPPDPPSFAGPVGAGVGRGQMIALLVAVFAVMLGYGVTLTVLPYYTTSIHRLNGVSDDALTIHIGALTGAYALAQLLAGPIIGRLTDRRGRRPVVLGGLVGVGLTQIAFGLVTSLWWLYALRVAGGVAASLLTVPAMTMIADWTDDERSRARGMALFGIAGTALITPNLSAVVSGAYPGSVGTSLGMKSSASSFGQFLGPVVGATLLAWRVGAPYALAAVVLGVAGVATAAASVRPRGEAAPDPAPAHGAPR